MWMTTYQDILIDFIKTHWYVSPTWNSWPIAAVGGSLFTVYLILIFDTKILLPYIRAHYGRITEERVFTWSSRIGTILASVAVGYGWGIAHGLGLAGFVKLYGFLAMKFHEGLE